MNKRLKIAIDCDEVLRRTVDGIVKLYNETFHTSMTRDDVKEFDVAISFPEILKQTGIPASKWLFDIHSRDLFFEKAKSFPGSDWAIETLQRYGDVTILSYQDSYENKRDTLDFLHREGLDTANTCFLNDKSRLDCDIMIDDNPEWFKGCKAKVCVLITAPYNENLDLKEISDSCDCEKVLRFKSLFDFAKYFKQVNGKII